MGCRSVLALMQLLSLSAITRAVSEYNEAGLYAGAITGGAQAWSSIRRQRAVFSYKIDGLGVNYGMVADNLPPPERVSQLLQRTPITSIKLYSADPHVLQAFARSGLSVVVGVANEDIPMLAASRGAASSWVASHVVPFPEVACIAVGNEVTSSDGQQLVSAMENVYAALRVLGLRRNVPVTTTNSMAVLATSYPPSAGTFRQGIGPVLEFLARTGGPFMANAYPYFAYKQDPGSISLDYALGGPNNPGVVDPATGLRYTSLLDAQLDAIYYAMRAAGYADDAIPVVVAETGWPSAGGPDEPGATAVNAREYNSNLIRRVASGMGTPARPRTPVRAYIFALFNENLKPGPTSERNFGLLRPDESPAYDVGLLAPVTSGDGPGVGTVPPADQSRGGTRAPVGPPAGQNRGGTLAPAGATWCVARPSTADTALEQCIEYACGEGGADCKPIQPGGTCYSPNNLVLQASFAMNSYFQRHGRNSWNCDFSGAGMTTFTDPSYGSCVYPSQ